MAELFRIALFEIFAFSVNLLMHIQFNNIFLDSRKCLNSRSSQYATGLKMYKIGINAGYSEDFLNSVLNHQNQFWALNNHLYSSLITVAYNT
jgi:hypothetical protein